jgi:hypothetical protein
MANLEFDPTKQAIFDVYDTIENDRISLREALRPSRWADVVSPDKIERWGNIGTDFRYPDSTYLTRDGDVGSMRGYNSDNPIIGNAKNVPILYEASAHPSALPIKAYEQVYRELGPEGIAHKASGAPPMREGPYGRVVRPTGTNGIQVVNSKQDPAYYKALRQQQLNIQRYYEMEFDRMRGLKDTRLTAGISEQMDREMLRQSLKPEYLGVNPPDYIDEAYDWARNAKMRGRWLDMQHADVSAQYDRQLLLQAMMKTGRLDNTLIPELHNNVLEAIKGGNGQEGFFYSPRGRMAVPSEYDFTVEGDTPDHPFSKVSKIYPDMASVPFGQDGLFDAFNAMYTYNQQVNKERLLGLRPPVAKEFGRVHKGGHAGFVGTDLLTAPYKPFISVAKGLAEEDQFLSTMQRGFSNPDTARNFARNYIQNPATRSMVNAELGASALRFAGKAGVAGAVAMTPFDALDRRDRNFTDFYERTGRDPSLEENMMLRVKSGLEPALSALTLGAYDAIADTPTYRAYLDQEQKDRAEALYRQQGIDFPMIGGYRTERTTR